MENSELLKAELESADAYELETEFNELNPVIEQILDKNGYSFKTWVVILLIGSLIFTDGLIMTAFSSMIIPFQKFYELTENELQIVSAILFAGVAVGAISSGLISKRFSRPQIITVCLLVLAILHLIVGFIANKIVYFICRFLMGLFLGFYLPMITNLLAEYLPVRHRALVINITWIGFILGGTSICIILLIIMPNLEEYKIKQVFLTISLIFTVIFIMNFFFLKDSARNFLIKNEHQKGFEILEDLYGKKLKIAYRDRILKELKVNTETISSSMSELFNDKFLVTTILVSLLWFINAVFNYGSLVVSTLIMKKLGMNQNGSNYQIIINIIIVNIPVPVFQIIGGLISEFKSTGRKGAIGIACLCGSVSILLSTFITKEFSIFLGLSMSFVGISTNVNTTYTSEIYPTRFRDFATGYYFCITRMGGFISQITYLKLFELYMFVPYYVSCALAIVGAICAICLPYETYGTPLDIEPKIYLKDVISDDPIKKD